MANPALVGALAQRTLVATRDNCTTNPHPCPSPRGRGNQRHCRVRCGSDKGQSSLLRGSRAACTAVERIHCFLLRGESSSDTAQDC